MLKDYIYILNWLLDNAVLLMFYYILKHDIITSNILFDSATDELSRISEQFRGVCLSSQLSSAECGAVFDDINLLAVSFRRPIKYIIFYDMESVDC